MRKFLSFRDLRLSRLGSLLGGGFSRAGFSPAILFANNEPGVWYDPSDLSTLFQDTAGTTPVTTPGQTVALMLDKSKGLTLGPELVTNGTFDSDTDWTKAAGWTISGGTANFSSGAIFNSIYQTITTVAGLTYKLSFDCSARTTGTFQIFAKNTDDSGALLNSSVSVTSTGSYEFIFTALSTITFFKLTPMTSGAGASFDNISVKEIPGNHATQPTTAARPTYQVDAGGRGYLSFDGLDDWMVTPTITPGIDKVQVFAGVRKMSDAATGFLVETSSSSATFDGSFIMAAPSGIVGSTEAYHFGSRGTDLRRAAAPNGQFAAPSTNVLVGFGDISGDLVTLRIDGTQVAEDTDDLGTGNFLAYPMYIGSRNGLALRFNGHLHQLITRFGANLEVAQIESTEAYVAGKTGVTL